jgi:hypothetical protein
MSKPASLVPVREFARCRETFSSQAEVSGVRSRTHFVDAEAIRAPDSHANQHPCLTILCAVDLFAEADGMNLVGVIVEGSGARGVPWQVLREEEERFDKANGGRSAEALDVRDPALRSARNAGITHPHDSPRPVVDRSHADSRVVPAGNDDYRREKISLVAGKHAELFLRSRDDRGGHHGLESAHAVLTTHKEVMVELEKLLCQRHDLADRHDAKLDEGKFAQIFRLAIGALEATLGIRHLALAAAALGAASLRVVPGLATREGEDVQRVGFVLHVGDDNAAGVGGVQRWVEMKTATFRRRCTRRWVRHV